MCDSYSVLISSAIFLSFACPLRNCCSIFDRNTFYPTRGSGWGVGARGRPTKGDDDASEVDWITRSGHVHS